MKTDSNPAVEKKFRAMGTDVQIELILGPENKRAEAEEALEEAEALFREYEKIFSRFDPESELSRINLDLNREMKVSGPMAEVLALCLKFNRIMEGYFDPRMIGNLEKIGYDRDFRSNDLNRTEDEKPGLEKIEAELDRELRIDLEKKTVKTSRRIDTTGIAKGFAVDQAAELLKSRGWKNFLVDAGGDMFAWGKNQDGEAWKVGVEGLEGDAVRIKLEDEGIATSGISRKRWIRGGKKFHHLVNPKDPEEFSHDLKTVTVVAEKTVEADGRAKSLFLMGREKGLEFANREKIKCLFLDYRNNVFLSEEMKKYVIIKN